MRSGKNLLRLFGNAGFEFAALAATITALIVAGTPVFAAPFQPDDWSTFEADATPSHTTELELAAESNAPRVRIPVTIRGFERVAAASSGPAARGARDVSIPRRARQFNLKARLDRSNHFYFGDWHIETVPLGKSRGEIQMKLSLSRTFGENHDLEEHLGDMTLAGGLTRTEPGVFTFMGKSRSRFTGRSGELVADLQVNAGRDGQDGHPGPNNDQLRDPAFGRVSRLEPVPGVKLLDREPIR